MLPNEPMVDDRPNRNLPHGLVQNDPPAQDRSEPSNSELLKRYPDSTTRADALARWHQDEAAAQARIPEEEWQAAKLDAEPDGEAEKRERLAALRAHPHTQLRGILADLALPAARSADITTKYSMLHAAVVRLASLIIAATPPPEDSEEKINEDFERKQQPAEGSHEQEPVS